MTKRCFDILKACHHIEKDGLVLFPDLSPPIVAAAVISNNYIGKKPWGIVIWEV